MRQKIIIIILLLTGFVCHSQTFQKKYKDKLKPNSNLVMSGFNYTGEKVNDTTFIFKRYYPETQMITCEAVYKSEKFDVLHGDYVDRYDDGTIVNQGQHHNHKKEGKWIDNVNEFGIYRNGKRIH